MTTTGSNHDADRLSEPGWVVERHGPTSTGAGSPLVVHVPHAGTGIPPEVRADLLLDDVGIEAELAAMTDWHTDALAVEALDRRQISATVFRNRLSRLVIDPERFPDEREVMLSRGMGAVYTQTSAQAPLRTSGPDEAARHGSLIDRYFHPYADALTGTVASTLERFGRCVLVDLHSYPSTALPYELDQTAARPGLCIGTDPTHTPDSLVALVAEAFEGVAGGVERDTPFAGTYVPLMHYGTDERVASVMIEIRRDLYLDEPSSIDPVRFDALVGRLASLFDSIVDAGGIVR